MSHNCPNRTIGCGRNGGASVEPGLVVRRVLVALVAAAVVGVLAPAAARADGGVGTGGKVAGAAVPNLAPVGDGDAVGSLGHLAANGMNMVSLYVWWQTDQGATSLSPSTQTVSDQELAAQITAARAAGLRVSLTPLFYCNGCEGGSRSVFRTDPAHPDRLAAFFSSYSAFIDHYAALAQANGASIFFVGSELSYLEAATGYWRGVIAGVRGIFHGQLAYEENWDVVGNAHFLDAVDLIGVSAYFPLDPRPSPTLSQLLADWHSSSVPGWQGRNWVAELQGLVRTYHRPILFGEVGYMSGDYAANHPYLNDYENLNWTLQADLYQAVLETFQGYGWWAGVMWWDYSSTVDGAGNGRTFAGKLAEVVLQMWYADGSRPASASTPLA